MHNGPGTTLSVLPEILNPPAPALGVVLLPDIILLLDVGHPDCDWASYYPDSHFILIVFDRNRIE
ncbi:hypothetical protein CVT25_001518 [Psilocybe cyanescens]|uniref:Uncharacterized protein n=1 Tax=Psilocybe cyanescens TaxID=93625 RepID=A0A409X5K7_PSICY|nr:hypothetical protein CVT25_001518 [Psilocybe cyanescens]